MPDNASLPLIVGAGPVGLAAALFLAQKGIAARIIDAAPQPSPYSRALAVNPRTLELLEPTGVTARMLERGLPVHGACFRSNDKILGEFSFRGLKHRYPFMLALSQAATETLLAEALQRLGREVERGSKLTACLQENAVITASIEMPGGIQTAAPPWLLAADGAHSAVREQLGIGFDGSGFPEEWYLADLPLATALPQDTAHVWFFDDGGFLFLIRVVEDIRKPGTPLWRVIANFPDLFDRLKDAKPVGAPVWESHFRVSHRIASQLHTGNVYLAGDAAHIHSPIGARGMNLGIEDAWTFAALMKAGKTEHYGDIRKPIDARVVQRVKMLTTMARGQSVFTRWARSNILPLALHIPLLRHQMLSTANGLDHPLEL